MNSFRKDRRPGNRGQTKAERERVSLVKRKGCLCCLQLGLEHDEDGPTVEAHHLLSGSVRRGHDYTVGLCAWHHRGRLTINGWTLGMHREFLGPSLADGSVPFHDRFGSDESLLDQEARLLGISDDDEAGARVSRDPVESGA